MNKRTGIIVALTLFFGILSLFKAYPQAVRIMPLGNSITYDERISPDTRPVGDRIAYRFRLYQLLANAGYDFDFVGSENAGNNFFQDTDLDDNAGFPGINDEQMAILINTGFNGRTGLYETPTWGHYLSFYPADIILLHIGTNDLFTDSPDDVEDILNKIRNYDSGVIILIARIINRKTYHSLTTVFNNNVEAMVNARGDNRIIVVDMENGAGIVYATDMYDNLHPKQTGYDKMAQKWFEAIESLNDAPVIDAIPDQHTVEGNSFSPLDLDLYVTDTEDPDYLLTWTYQLASGTNLSVSIDGNRDLHVSPVEPDWYGSETIKLKVTDSGNGAFRKADSVQVTFYVDRANRLPEITSEPDTLITVDNGYMYELTASDPDPLDNLTYDFETKPDWLIFYAGADQGVLYGTPHLSDLGQHTVTLIVNDGHANVYQQFTIEVKNATGTEEETMGQSVVFFPNPVKDKSYLRINEPLPVEFLLFDVTGTLVKTLQSKGNSDIEIDMIDFPTGVYLYKATINQVTITGKIIKN